MFSPGDVVLIWNDDVGKEKFHLCICPTGKFLFLNSPKKKAYPGDFNVPSAEIPLPPTPEGYSVISCTHLIMLAPSDFKRLRAIKKGTVSNKLLLKLIAFVDKTPVLSEEEKDAILEGLGDWA
jgi:hypothetical protein